MNDYTPGTADPPVATSNRKAYVVVAEGDIAVVSGRWRAFCKSAFLTQEDAEASEAGFLDRCKAAEHELLGPDPATLKVRTIPLNLADDLDAPDGQVYLISAEGRDTLFESRVPFLCGTLYASKEQAERELPAFLDRCADPELGPRYSLKENLTGKIGALTLRDGPEEIIEVSTPGP